MKEAQKISHTIAAIILLASAICSCSRIQYVPVETIRRDSIDRIVDRHDSIHVTDSVTVTLRGDTVWRDRWRTIYKETARRDTIYKESRDTVAVPYPVETRPTLAKRIADAVAAALAMAVVAAGIWLAVRAARGRG